MCNLSQGIKEKGIAIGEAKGEAKGRAEENAEIIHTMYHNGLTIEQIATYTNTSINDVQKIIEEKDMISI